MYDSKISGKRKTMEKVKRSVVSSSCSEGLGRDE